MRCFGGPSVYDWALGAVESRGLAARRGRLLAAARGRVLEIGGGTGLNLPHYRPDRVDSLTVLEPDSAMRERLTLRAAAVTVPLEIRGETIEAAALTEGSFDTIVVTLTLCSVPDPAAAAAAIFTWLVPGGRLLLIEHVAGRGWRGRLQRAVTPLWARVAGGCQLDRDTLTTLRHAGLSVSDCDRFAMPATGPLFATCVQAVAWRPPIGEPDAALSVLHVEPPNGSMSGSRKDS